MGVIPGEQAQAPLPACDTLQNQPCRSSVAAVPRTDTAAAVMSIANTPCSRRGIVAVVLRLTGRPVESALAWIDDQPVVARRAVVKHVPVVTLRGPAAGDHTFRLAVTAGDGELVTVKRPYRACAERSAPRARGVRHRRTRRVAR